MSPGPKSQRPQRDRLPPRQRAVAELRVIDLGVQPAFDPDTWRLEVGGLVRTELRLSWQEYLDLPRVRRVADFHCVEGWSVLECRWEGVLLGAIAEAAKPQPDAHFVYVESEDGYSTNMPLDVAMDDDVLLADRLNGEPLPEKFGGPVRLVVPKKYAYKSAKWVRRIEFISEDRPGYWELRGYSNTADPWTNDRLASPTIAADSATGPFAPRGGSYAAAEEYQCGEAVKGECTPMKQLSDCEHCGGKGTCTAKGGRSCRECLDATGHGAREWVAVRCSYCGGRGKVLVEAKSKRRRKRRRSKAKS